MLVNAAPPNLNKWVVFTKGPGYYQTFLLGAVLVLDGRSIKVGTGHRPIEGRFCLFLWNRAIHKIYQQYALVGQQHDALFLANHLFYWVGDLPLHVIGVCHANGI